MIAAEIDLDELSAVASCEVSSFARKERLTSCARAYIATEISKLLETPAFLDALPGYLLPDQASQAHVSILLERLKTMAALSMPVTGSGRTSETIISLTSGLLEVLVVV